MCLFTDQDKAIHVKETITCFKIVRVYDHIKAKMFSVYFDYKYEMGKQFEVKAFLNESSDNQIRLGFHSYKHLSEAKRNARCFMPIAKNSGFDVIIIKCEIPIDALYYTGYDSPDAYIGEEEKHKQYCSNSIKVVAWKKVNGTHWHTDNPV